MGALDIARKADPVHGPTLDRWRSFVPRALLLYWIAKETGWDRLAVSSDRYLIEVGWGQLPLARARALGADPFNVFGACWLACVEILHDAAHWRAAESDDPERRRIGSWLLRADRNLWWVVQMDYSIGTGALRHVLNCAISRAEANHRTPSDLGLMAEALDWLRVTDIALPVHARHWGRQKPEQIAARMRKHKAWTEEAAKLGPIDDAPAGGEPPTERPSFVPPFPAELVRPANVCALGSRATAEQHEAAWKAVRAYRDKRRRQEFARRVKHTAKAPLAFRAAQLIAAAGGREVVEPVVRD